MILAANVHAKSQSLCTRHIEVFLGVHQPVVLRMGLVCPSFSPNSMQYTHVSTVYSRVQPCTSRIGCHTTQLISPAVSPRLQICRIFQNRITCHQIICSHEKFHQSLSYLTESDLSLAGETRPVYVS